MDAPVFKLEGIVKSKDEVSDFEGPLVLILQLLSKDKIEIRDISISNILDQYLAFLDEMAELDLDVASEFVTMASHLTYIKTKMLLSGGEEVSELEQLISSLEELQRGEVYLQIKEVSQILSGMYARDGALMTGPPEYLPIDNEYKYVHVSFDLIDALLRILQRENVRLGSQNPREMVIPNRITFSIPEKISEILDKLKQVGQVPVAALFHDASNRPELVATLIAILELCKVGNLALSGAQDELIVTFSGVGRDPSTEEITEDMAREAEAYERS
ncbi:MAG: segregation/condensation protein A [Oscillospiraceae bacterium]|nr:segregation/condensation protein A [Oscillospiraceae bacterium]